MMDRASKLDLNINIIACLKTHDNIKDLLITLINYQIQKYIYFLARYQNSQGRK